MTRKNGVGSNQYRARIGSDIDLVGSPDLMGMAAQWPTKPVREDKWDGDLDNIGPDRTSVAISDVPDGELCYIFQHLDSRGGTVGVWASSREQADAAYVQALFDGDEEYASGVIEEDYNGMAWFRTPPEADAADLDDGPTVVLIANADWYAPAEGDQVPILRCFRKEDIGWDSDDESETYTDSSGCRWGHPQWNDDAFGFLPVFG